jgi:hypothetical protein
VLGGTYDQPVTIALPTTDTLDIVGGGATDVGSSPVDPAFTVERGTVTISGLSVALNGGQGIDVVAGTVDVVRDTVTGGAAPAGGAVEIGAGATATLTDDTFVHDSATTGGGAVANRGTATVTFDTFSGDSAPAGGGLDNLSGTATILGDLFADGGAAGANCTAGAGTVVDGGYNTADNADCGLHAAAGDVVGAPDSGTGGIDLGPLARDGGPPTLAIGPQSAAAGAVPGAACPPTDERGVARGQTAGTGACDSGAYEVRGGP